jgi:signal transduction histidine kinase
MLNYLLVLIIILLHFPKTNAQIKPLVFEKNGLKELVENPFIITIDSIYRKMSKDRKLTEDDLKKLRTKIYEMSDNAFFDDAEKYLGLFLDLVKEKGTTKDKALIYHAFGYNSKKRGAYDEALKYYKKSVALREEIGDREGMAPTLSNIANIYYDIGNYSLAIDTYRQSLTIRMEINDEKGIARTLSGIGNVLSDQGRYDEALQNYRQALFFSLKHQDTIQIANLNTNLAQVKYVLKELDSSFYFSQKSLQFANAIGYSYISGYAFENIGKVYLDKGNFSKAEEYLRSSLLIREQLQSPLEVTLTQIELARLYRYTERPVEALQMSKVAYETSTIINFLKGQQQASEQLSGAYEMIDDYQSALHYYKEYKNLSDTLFTIEEKKIIDNTQTQIIIERETYGLKLKQDKESAFYTLLLLCFSILMVSGIIWFFYSRKLRDRQHEISIRQKELESEQKIIYSTQSERIRISQDMHDDLGTSLSGLRIFSEMLFNKTKDEQSKQELQKLFEMTKEITLKVRDIVWTLNNKNDFIDNLIWYCHHYAENLLGNFLVQLNVKVQKGMPKIEISGHTRKQLFLTVKEALNNILKHAEANKVELSFRYADEVFMIQITDNGKGFDVKLNNTSGNGIQNMKSRMAALEGSFQVLSDHTGSTITLNVNLPQKGYFLA